MTIELNAKCSICKMTTGPLKKIEDNWFHVTCLIINSWGNQISKKNYIKSSNNFIMSNVLFILHFFFLVDTKFIKIKL